MELAFRRPNAGGTSGIEARHADAVGGLPARCSRLNIVAVEISYSGYISDAIPTCAVRWHQRPRLIKRTRPWQIDFKEKRWPSANWDIPAEWPRTILTLRLKKNFRGTLERHFSQIISPSSAPGRGRKTCRADTLQTMLLDGGYGMTYFDFAPLSRSTIGFDRVFDLLAHASQLSDEGYPPYNIIRTGDNAYRLELAVAGFTPDELTLTSHENALIVTGRHSDDDKADYLHRGIAARPFERRFNLADYVTVVDASLNNGMLSVELRREVPEAKKPRTIAIGSGKQQQKTIDHQQAA
jgi:molecular chaperone IbpA